MIRASETPPLVPSASIGGRQPLSQEFSPGRTPTVRTTSRDRRENPCPGLFFEQLALNVTSEKGEEEKIVPSEISSVPVQKGTGAMKTNYGFFCCWDWRFDTKIGIDLWPLPSSQQNAALLAGWRMPVLKMLVKADIAVSDNRSGQPRPFPATRWPTTQVAGHRLRR